MTSRKPHERHLPFLALPPFPKRKLDRFELCGEDVPPLSEGELNALVEQLVEARVGGTWWGARPALGPGPYVLIRASLKAASLPAAERMLIWTDDETRAGASVSGDIGGVCDPWHMLSGATELHCTQGDSVLLIAGLAGVPVRIIGDQDEARQLDRSVVRTMLAEALGSRLTRNPFSGDPLPWAELINLCALWRAQIDANRALAAAYGFAGWKRATTEPLLWDGSAVDRINRPSRELKAGDKVAVWKSRTPVDQLAALEQAGAILVEVEDGFIRSAGLGANCVPPQSIVIDDLSAHFDARSPSRLELMLQEQEFPFALLDRARALRSIITSLGISKYDVGEEPLERRSPRLHVLVPGQVEDDRAVLCTPGSPITNLELLRRVRSSRPDAYIIYKPHPDVEAGHRKGAIPDSVALGIADEVVRAPSISSWIALADEVHVNSSLAGFEALLRDKRVTTFGVPFYAGWGLTEDLGQVPARRTARRTLDELVAATLIVYPRYVDPVTNLPCSPEVLIARLSHAPAPRFSIAILARRLQGQLMRHLNFGIGGR